MSGRSLLVVRWPTRTLPAAVIVLAAAIEQARMQACNQLLHLPNLPSRRDLTAAIWRCVVPYLLMWYAACVA